MAVGRFFYDACIPINAVNSFYFKPMLDAISVIGPAYKGPNYHQLRVNLLKDAKKEDIGKMDHVAELVRRASNVTIFMYNHVALLSWLRKRERWIEILRPGATRFATTFIALKSLHDHKHDLQALVTSKFFVDSRYSKDYKSKVAVSIILDNRFWNDCLIVVNLMSPLMRLLRIVDCDERPSMGYVYEGMYRENFCNKPNVIGGVMDVIDQKVLKSKLETMNEMKLFRDRLGSFGRDLAYSSRECTTFAKVSHSNIEPNRIVFWMFYSKKIIYDPINYACIDETDFWVVHDDQPTELDDEELENLLYEEGSIPINEVKGSSSHIDDEDGGDVAIEGLDAENFGFSNAHFQSSYSNFQNE
uniref:DUF659 domain-containing protein n=1 Tax=Vitis vinifera TaxID=29760 RepID=A5AUD6_VITVI|nr:hypothetical protein VITISV_038391 [Vitis vinifera]